MQIPTLSSSENVKVSSIIFMMISDLCPLSAIMKILSSPG